MCSVDGYASQHFIMAPVTDFDGEAELESALRNMRLKGEWTTSGEPDVKSPCMRFVTYSPSNWCKELWNAQCELPELQFGYNIFAIV